MGFHAVPLLAMAFPQPGHKTISYLTKRNAKIKDTTENMNHAKNYSEHKHRRGLQCLLNDFRNYIHPLFSQILTVKILLNKVKTHFNGKALKSTR